MATLFNLVNPSFLPRYTGLVLSEGVTGKVAPWKTAYLLKDPIIFTRQGTIYDTERLTPNHTYIIHFGKLKVRNSDILLRFHPDLAEKGIISSANGYHPGYEGLFQFTYRPFEAFDVKDLEYIASISIIN